MFRKFTVIHQLDAMELRDICVKGRYYTRGTNSEYCHLFSKVLDMDGDIKDLTEEDMYEIAEDIVEHSDIDRIRDETGLRRDDILAEVIYEIYRKSVRYVVIND